MWHGHVEGKDNGDYVKTCTNGLQFSAYLSADTVTGDDSNPTPETKLRRLSAEIKHAPMVAKK